MKSVSAAIPLLLVGAVQGITTLCTGSKQAVTGFAMYCLFAFLVTGRIPMRHLSLILALSPLILGTVTGVSEYTSGRLGGYPTRFVMQYHAFRYDLSDLAITIAEREARDPKRGFEEGCRVVREALEMAVPSILSGKHGKGARKPETLLAYPDQLSGIGLYPNTDDYNDTFFSMGAQLWGYPGIFLAFAGILLLYELLGKINVAVAERIERNIRRTERATEKGTGEAAEIRWGSEAAGSRSKGLRTAGRIIRRVGENKKDGDAGIEGEEREEGGVFGSGQNRSRKNRTSGMKAAESIEGRAQQEENRQMSMLRRDILLLEIPYSMQTEGDWFMWIYRTRDFVIEMLAFLILFLILRNVGVRSKTIRTKRTADQNQQSDTDRSQD